MQKRFAESIWKSWRNDRDFACDQRQKLNSIQNSDWILKASFNPSNKSRINENKTFTKTTYST